MYFKLEDWLSVVLAKWKTDVLGHWVAYEENM